MKQPISSLEARMTTETIDQFGAKAAAIAMRGAADFMKAQGLKLDADVNCDKLITAIRRHAVDAVTVALADAREAIDAGMGQWAETTFVATMRLAGIEAVKEVR